MKAFVLIENADAARELVSGARAFAGEVALVTVSGLEAPGVADVNYVIDNPDEASADDSYETLISLVDKDAPAIMFVEPTRRMKVIAGRLAARKGTSVVTDVIEFKDSTAINLYFGGIAHKTQKVVTPLAIYSVGAGVFAESDVTGSDAVEHVDWVTPSAASIKLRSSEEIKKSGIDLAKVDIVVAAGRGFATKGELDWAREFTDKVGGGLGCTRPLTEGVDWMPRELYIGVSGQMLSPETYIGIGVSGQMQHMVGVNRAKTIIAINKDKNAPIFKQADIGLVGEISKVLPEINARL